MPLTSVLKVRYKQEIEGTLDLILFQCQSVSPTHIQNSKATSCLKLVLNFLQSPKYLLWNQWILRTVS